MPVSTISDEQGTLHALPNVSQAGTGGYVSVVTLGAYQIVKVDASYGAIHAGDLLTSSPNPGYAMKVTDRTAAIDGHGTSAYDSAALSKAGYVEHSVEKRPLMLSG